MEAAKEVAKAGEAPTGCQRCESTSATKVPKEEEHSKKEHGTTKAKEDKIQ